MRKNEVVDALDSIADELYGLPPEEFTSARNNRAKDLRMDDAALATRIQALRKPSAAAWLANLLVRDRAAEVEEALTLGARLREAQDGLDRVELASLAKQRRALVTALARSGAELAGKAVTAAVTEELAQTLQAAMTDAAAAEALRTGRLMRSLQAVGFEPVDLDGAVAGGPGSAPRAPAPPRDELAEKRREHARRAAAEAEQRAATAGASLTAAEREIADVEKRRDRLESELAGLEERVRELKKSITAADREARSLDRERDKAARTAEAAEADLAAAREALE